MDVLISIAIGFILAIGFHLLKYFAPSKSIAIYRKSRDTKGWSADFITNLLFFICGVIISIFSSDIRLFLIGIFS